MKKLPKEYKIGGKLYAFDLNEIKGTHSEFMGMNDDEFLENIVGALHLAVYICWIKNIPTDDCLSDTGIIHELVHLVKENTRKYTDIVKVRKMFNEKLIM